MFPSVSASFTPVTVTVWFTFQFALVNVSVTLAAGVGNAADETSPSPVFVLVTGTVTFVAGCVDSLTVNVAGVRFSLVGPEIPETMRLAVSLSAIVTVAADGVITQYVGTAGVKVTITVSGPSISPSSITATVMVADDAPGRIVTEPDSAV